ncbi:MAG: UDP-N-acetylmuramate--alanine ligase [Cyclobacteriaceae bacterium]|jgi:UDP-N-acetylmuramate--alanine ligase
MKLDGIHSVYFIGIGGIGMSSLARWFKHRGAQVAGYDRVSTTLTQKLEQEGIEIHYEDNLALLPEWTSSTESTLVVYTPAIPKDHKGLHHLRSLGHDLKKRSEVLGMITSGHYTLAIAGTHGKTTTSSMLAHILQGSDAGCSAFVGGIMTNYDSNLIIGETGAPVVVEADEFDRSFMQLHPDFTVVTSIDPDHLDIYGDGEEMTQSYLAFIQLTDKDGKIILQGDVAKQIGHKIGRSFLTYGLSSATITANNLRIDGNKFIFDYEGDLVIKDIKLSLPGYHNMLNATAAITAGLHMGMAAAQVKEQIESYRGVKRRFQYIIDQPGFTYIDDYAHHPSEIEALLISVKKLYPNRSVTTIFQPHLYTRTKDFYEGFAKSLSLSDRVILLDIYPARELPIKGVSAQMIFDLIETSNKQLVSRDVVPSMLDELQADVLLTVGAGDIDTLVPIIQSHFQKETSL